MFKWVVALVLAAAMSLPALADGEYRRHRYYQPHYYIYLPPERHVIEVVQPPWSGNFIINGSRFTAKTPACWRWAAGERIRLLAGDWNGAADEARWALDAGAGESDSPIGRYAAALAALVLGDWVDARVHADHARTSAEFPGEVADALAFIAAEDVVGYTQAVEDVRESFETRTEYLEDIPVADTVLVLQALARRRGMAAELESPLLP